MTELLHLFLTAIVPDVNRLWYSILHVWDSEGKERWILSSFKLTLALLSSPADKRKPSELTLQSSIKKKGLYL